MFKSDFKCIDDFIYLFFFKQKVDVDIQINEL